MALAPSVPSPQNTASVLASSCQLLRVIAPGWDSNFAVLQRYERTRFEAGWQPVGAVVKVMLGKSGLAWGLSLIHI